MKKYQRKLKAGTIVCFSLLPFVASAASFNCNRATKAAEFAVCANYTQHCHNCRLNFHAPIA
jgi:uncharacterized protein